MTDPRTRRRLAPEDRRAEIIEVATRQISESGFNTFTLSRLAAACGLSRKGVEHHFGSSAEILIAVLSHRDDVDRRDFLPDEPNRMAEADLWAALDALVARNASRPEIIRLYAILGAEALDPGHPAHAYFLRRSRIARAGLAGACRDWHPDPEAFAVEVLARLDGLQLQWLRDPSLDLVALWRDAGDALARHGAARAGRMVG